MNENRFTDDVEPYRGPGRSAGPGPVAAGLMAGGIVIAIVVGAILSLPYVLWFAAVYLG